MGLNFELIIIIFALSSLTINFVKVSADENLEQYVPCKTGWYFFGDKCYKTFGLNTRPLSWHESQDSCLSHGGNLASIHSSELQEFLTVFFLLSSKSDLWIGLHDRRGETVFSWVDGSVYNYTNWNINEPVNRLRLRDNEDINEDCVDLGYSEFENINGKWRDQLCEFLKPYICQVDKDYYTKSPDPRFCSIEDGGGWKYLNSCFHMVKEEKSWDDAEKYCKENYNGYIISILNDNDEVFLNYIQSEELSKSFWIGIKMRNTSMQKWTSGWHVANKKLYQEKLPFANDTCIIKNNRNYWVIVPCHNKYTFICEKVKYNLPVLQRPPSDDWKCPHSSKKLLDLGGDSCYYIENETSQNWLEANYECGKIGGTLASIHSENETKLLKHHLFKTQKSLLIGLRRNSTNNMFFEWADGTNVDYQNWNFGEPSSSSEICGELYALNMAWNDASCHEAKGYICKIKKVFSSSKIKELSGQISRTSACLKDQIYPSGVPAGTVVGIVFCALLIGLFGGAIIDHNRYYFRRFFANVKNDGFTSTTPGYLGDVSDKVLWKPQEDLQH